MGTIFVHFSENNYMGNLKDRIKSSSFLTSLAHLALKPRNQYRPRWWVRNIWNPFKHKKGNGTVVCRMTRMDVMPYNQFEMGEKCLIEDFATVNNAVGDVFIGDRSLIGLSSVVIGPVNIGDDVMLAQHVVLSGLNHGYQNTRLPIKDQPVSTLPITIEDGVWIGANSVITAGVKVGKHSVVAGGSVVIKDVPAYSVVAGNPAKVIKQYSFKTDNWERVKSDNLYALAEVRV